MFIFHKTINGHTKKTLKKHCAGKFIENPENLEIGTSVSVFQKDTYGAYGNSDGWWERGEICQKDGIKQVNVYDGNYRFDEVEVYLTKCPIL